MKKKIFMGLLAIILCVVLVGCANTKKDKGIVGVWKNDTTYTGYEFVYTFNEDGTGKYDAAGTIMEFKYTVDGDKLSITYTGDTSSFDTTYSIKDDTLNVLDSLGNDTLYKRVK